MAERTIEEYEALRHELQEKIQKEGFSDLEFIGETWVGFLYKYKDLMITSKVVIHVPGYDPAEHFEMKKRYDEKVQMISERKKKKGDSCGLWTG